MIGTGTVPQPKIVLHGVCYDCRKRHEYVCTPERFPHAMSEWATKHAGHRFEFRSPRREILSGHKPSVFRAMMKWFDGLFDRHGVAPWWLEQFSPNADMKIAYAASASFTFGIEGLASSSTFLSGWESTAVSNTTNLYLDYLIAGKITVGTTPTTAKSIRVYAYGSQNDTPLYPDALDGTSSAESITNAEILNALPILAVIGIVATTSDLAYWFSGKSIALSFGGIVPKNFGLYGAHDTVAALNATAANQVVSHIGIYGTSV